MRRTLLFALSAVVLMAAAPRPAMAQEKPSAADVKRARLHYGSGKALFARGDFRAAVEEFKTSYRLSKNPLLLYNIAFTFDKLDDIERAVRFYQMFIDKAPVSAPRIKEAKARLATLTGATAQARPAEETPAAEDPGSSPAGQDSGSTPASSATAGDDVIDRDAADSPIHLTAQAGPEKDAGGINAFSAAKWGTTGAAVGLVSISVAFYMLAGSAASDLEAAAADSRGGTCMSGPPCDVYSDEVRDLADKGQRYETWGHVALGFGVAAAAAATTLWVLDLRDDPGSEQQSGIVAHPVIGNDFVGAAATFSL